MSAVSRRCTLVLPGLLDLPAQESTEALTEAGPLPALELLLARARRGGFGRAGLEAVLYELFEADFATDRDLPVAATTYQADRMQPAPGWCLRADPVHLVPDRDHLVLLGPEALGLSQAEADQLAQELTRFFAEDGWRLEAATPTRWYLHLPEAPQIRTYDLPGVRGKAIRPFLPTGKEGKQWHRIMNEVQMVLHASVVNRERLAMGRLPVSSLWFWGGGALCGLGHSRWSQLWSDEPVGQGLAQFSCTPRQALPAGAQDWLQQANAPGEHVIVLDALREAWQGEGMEAWQQALQTLHQGWFVPLLEALRQRRLDQLTLYSCDGQQFSVSPSALKRWWKRPAAVTRYSQSD